MGPQRREGQPASRSRAIRVVASSGVSSSQVQPAKTASAATSDVRMYFIPTKSGADRSIRVATSFSDSDSNYLLHAKSVR